MNKKSRAIDMTQGNPLRCMLLFVIPVIGGNLLQQLYTFFDTMIVGRTLGVVQLAAVGMSGSLSFLAMGFTIGNSSGCSVLTSQRLGAGDKEGVERAIAAHYLISLIEAVVLTAVFIALTRPLLKLLNTAADMFEYSYRYISIIYLGLPATILYNLLSATLRAVGDSRTPLLFLAFSSVLNIVLDLVFIVYLHWDVQGAAIATVISQLVSGVLCFFYTRKRFPHLIPKRSAFKGAWKEAGVALKIGIPMGINVSVTAAGIVILARVLNMFGSNGVAAFSMCSKIQRVIDTVATAVGTMIATFVGQNFGARRYDRIRTGMRQITLLTLAYLIVVPSLAYIFRYQLVGLFVDDGGPVVMGYVEEYMRWICATMFLTCFLQVFRGGNIGLGSGKAALALALGELAARGVITPLLAPVIGFTSICVSGPISWVICSVIGLILFVARMRKVEKEYPQAILSDA